MQAAEQMVDIIQTMITQDHTKADQLELCEVTSIVDPSHYVVRPVSDPSGLVGVSAAKVVNMTRFDLSVGDFCYVYKIGNNWSNAFICYSKGGTTAAQCRMMQQMIDAAIAPLQAQITQILEQGGSGSNLPVAEGEYF